MEKPHKKLDGWKLSMDLAIDVYKTTDSFPSQEKYSLVDQIRRATISIPSNIAEGAARQTKKEFANTSISPRDRSVSWIRNSNSLDDSATQMTKLGEHLVNGWSGSINYSAV